MTETPESEHPKPQAPSGPAGHVVPEAVTEVRAAQPSVPTPPPPATSQPHVASQAPVASQPPATSHAPQSPMPQSQISQPQMLQAQMSQPPQAPAESHARPASVAQPAQYAQPEQPTVPLADAAFASPAQAREPRQAESTHPKSRSGALVAGIAIGALLGGLVGGGTAAVVAANLPDSGSQTVAVPNGTITLNNTEEVTNVSAVAAMAMPSVVTIQVTGTQASGSGSGVIYSEDGYIITNNHVATLDGAAGEDASIRVRLSDGRVLDGTLVGTDPFSDLAVVKVEAEGLTPIQIGDPNELNVGDLAIAIGAPLNLPNTVTSGVVSALYRGIAVGTANLPRDNDPSTEENESRGSSPWDFRFGAPGEQLQPSQGTTTVVTLPVVQTDASINPGNSGGALLNAQGELIGVNVAIASNGNDASTAGSDGLGFAIPSHLASRVADAIIAGERPSHGLLGANVDDSSKDVDEDANRAGALLTGISRGGAAEAAGLAVGDVVVSLNGIPVDSGTTLSALVRMQEGGKEVTLEYTRGGVPNEVTTTLGTLEW